jgi:hypothetical protein
MQSVADKLVRTGELQIVDRGTLVRSGDGPDGNSCAFPSVAVLPGGRWLVGYRASSRKGDEGDQHIRLTWSDDEGRSWHGPTRPFEAPTLNGRPGRFRMGCLEPLGGDSVLIALAWQDYGDPDRPVFNPKSDGGTVDFKSFFAISGDRGLTWSEMTEVDRSPFHNVPTPLTGPIRVLPNGDWACQMETNKPYEHSGQWDLAAVMKFSSDGGRTWPRHVKHAWDPSQRLIFGDARPRVMRDDSLLSFYWTFDSKTGLMRNIHAARSTDMGRTWTAPWDTGVPGQAAPPISLPHGVVALAYVDRTSVPTIKVRLSADGGQTFADESELIVQKSLIPERRHGDHTDVNSWINDIGKYAIGLPDTAPLANDGEFLLVYYNGPDQDHTDLEWARLRHTTAGRDVT